MRVVWLDRVFFINLAADLIALTAAGRLCAARIRIPRLMLGGVLGALYACAAAVLGEGPLFSLPVKLAVGVLLTLTVYGGEEKLLRSSLVFFLVSAAMAGIALGASAALGESGGELHSLSARALIVTMAVTLAALTAAFKFAAARRGTKGGVRELRLTYAGKTIRVAALADTGNALRDPVSGAELPIVESQKIAELFSGGAASVLIKSMSATRRMEALFAAAPELRCRLVPYSAVGVENGLLLAVRLDSAAVDGRPLDGGWVALSPTRVSETGEYGALIGGIKEWNA